MGNVIDGITAGTLSQADLLWSLLWLVLSAIGMYLLRYIWRMYILGTSYHLGQLIRYRLFRHFTKMSPSFIKNIGQVTLWHNTTNDINALTRLAGGGVMSAVDASITTLVTLATMFFTISWQMTLIAIIPLPFMALATSRLGRKTHKAFNDSQRPFPEIE